MLNEIIHAAGTPNPAAAVGFDKQWFDVLAPGRVELPPVWKTRDYKLSCEIPDFTSVSLMIPASFLGCL